MTIVKLAPRQANKILKQNRLDCGERDSYLVNLFELKILLSGDATVKELNKSNGDQTWSHEVTFGGKAFICFTSHHINF